MPGEKGIIKVAFDSRGKTGTQSKRVTITANTNPAQTFLLVKGEVLSAAGEEVPQTVERDNVLDTDGNALNADSQIPIVKDCFAIFPNPTTDVLILALNEYRGESAKIKILNSAGSTLTTRTIKELTQDIEFEVSHYSAGTYYVNIQIGNAAPATKCFVIAKL